MGLLGDTAPFPIRVYWEQQSLASAAPITSKSVRPRPCCLFKWVHHTAKVENRSVRAIAGREGIKREIQVKPRVQGRKPDGKDYFSSHQVGMQLLVIFFNQLYMVAGWGRGIFLLTQSLNGAEQLPFSLASSTRGQLTGDKLRKLPPLPTL